MGRSPGIAAFVLALAAACGGAASQETTVAPAPSAAPSATAPGATASASATPAPSASAATPPKPAKSAACVALDAERAPVVARMRAMAESKDPLSRAAAMGDDVRTAFAECKETKSGGAWGLGIKDLTEDEVLHGFQARAVAWHVDDKGAKTSFVLPSLLKRLGDKSFQSHDNDRVVFDALTTFDFDGDGEEELIVAGHDQTKEGPREPISYIVTVKNGKATAYAPAAGILFFRTEDIDHDGRPDLVTYGPYRAHTGARCNDAPTAFNGPAMLAHSLTDGTFSLTDGVAIGFAKQACDHAGFTVARDDQKNVDDEQTLVNIACARLWGMSASQAVTEVAKNCRVLTGDAACKETALQYCVYPKEMKAWAKVNPPLRLK